MTPDVGGIGHVEPSRTAAQPGVITTKISPTDAKTKRQAVKIEGKLEADITFGQMKAVPNKGEQLSVARRVLGSEADKQLLRRANEALEKPLPPSQEVLGLFRRVKGIRMNASGVLEIERRGLFARKPEEILKDIRQQLQAHPDELRDEAIYFIKGNPSLNRIREKDVKRQMEVAVGPSFFGEKVNIEKQRQQLIEIQKAKDELRDEEIQLKRAQQCIQIINESGGKLKLAGSKFELNDYASNSAHIDTITQLFAHCPLIRELIPSIIASPVLSSALKSREFWTSEVGQTFLKKGGFFSGAATPTDDGLRLLDLCGDTLKIVPFSQYSRTYLRFEPKEAGEASLNIDAIKLMIADAEEEGEESKKEVLEMMSRCRCLNEACAKAGFSTFSEVNASIGDNVALIEQHLMPIAQERIGQFKQFLETDRGKEWAKVNCMHTDNLALFFPSFAVESFEKKTNKEGEESATLTVRVTPQWRYPGGDGGTKEIKFEPEAAHALSNSLEPFTLTVELPRTLMTTAADGKQLIQMLKSNMTFKPVVISQDRKRYVDNLDTAIDAIMKRLRPIRAKMEASAGRDIFMLNIYTLSNIQPQADGKASMTVQITPRYEFAGAPKEEQVLIELQPRELIVTLPHLQGAEEALGQLQMDLRQFMLEEENNLSEQPHLQRDI